MIEMPDPRSVERFAQDEAQWQAAEAAREVQISRTFQEVIEDSKRYSSISLSTSTASAVSISDRQARKWRMRLEQGVSLADSTLQNLEHQ